MAFFCCHQRSSDFTEGVTAGQGPVCGLPRDKQQSLRCQSQGSQNLAPFTTHCEDFDPESYPSPSKRKEKERCLEHVISVLAKAGELSIRAPAATECLGSH